MNPNLQLLLALLTIVGSGVVSAVVTYKLNSKKAEREFLRMKLEDCYDALHRFCMLGFGTHLVFVEALKGTWTWDEANDMLKAERDSKERDHLPALEKLVNIYFPDLKEDLDQIEVGRDLLIDCQTEARKCYLTQRPKDAVQQYLSGMKQFTDIETEFKKAIFVLASSFR